MAEAAADLLDGSNPTVAPYAKDGEALLRVTAMAENEHQAEELCRPVLEKINNRLGEYIYGIDVTCIEEAVVEMLKEKSLTLAAAESCTGGLIAKRITDVSGASSVFGCGVVSYANEIKHGLLGVSLDDLERFGAVSAPVAEQMAIGVLKLSGADIAVSVTGIAGPLSDGTDKPVGLSYIALADKNTVWVKELKSGKNDRSYNRYVNASNTLNMVRLYLNNSLKEA